MSRSLVLFAILALAQPVAAQVTAQNTKPAPAQDTAKTSTRKSLHAVRLAADVPTIDGRLTEAVWSMAPAGTDFVQMRPNPGEPSKQQTEVRFAYDDDAIYVGVRLHDTAPDSIVGQLSRRDEEVYSDWVYICLDSYY